MHWNPALLVAAGLAGSAAVPVAAHARVYVSVSQAQRAMFGDEGMTPFPVALTPAQQERIRELSGVSLPFQGNRVWRSAAGGWFVVDEVVGKHEMITYAVGINADGTVRQVEILEYRESYGHEVAGAAWLGQFKGRNAEAPLRLGGDVQNISGATLSSKHVAGGVKRVLLMHALVLQAR